MDVLPYELQHLSVPDLSRYTNTFPFPKPVIRDLREQSLYFSGSRDNNSPSFVLPAEIGISASQPVPETTELPPCLGGRLRHWAGIKNRHKKRKAGCYIPRRFSGFCFPIRAVPRAHPSAFPSEVTSPGCGCNFYLWFLRGCRSRCLHWGDYLEFAFLIKALYCN